MRIAIKDRPKWRKAIRSAIANLLLQQRAENADTRRRHQYYLENRWGFPFLKPLPVTEWCESRFSGFREYPSLRGQGVINALRRMDEALGTRGTSTVFITGEEMSMISRHCSKYLLVGLYARD